MAESRGRIVELGKVESLYNPIDDAGEAGSFIYALRLQYIQ